MQDGQMDAGGCVYYKLSCEPKCSDELKKAFHKAFCSSSVVCAYN